MSTTTTAAAEGNTVAAVPAQTSAVVVADESKTATTPKRSKFTTYFRLLMYADPTAFDIFLLVAGFFSAIASGVPFPLMGILFGQLVDDVNSATCNTTPGTSYQDEVNEKVPLVVYLGIAYFALIYIYMVSWNLAGERLAQRLRERYFSSLLRQEALFFDDFSAGEVSSRLTGDITTIQNGANEKVGIVLSTCSFFVTAYIVAFLKNSKLGAMLVSLLPACLIMSLAGGYYVQKFSSSMMESSASAASIALEALKNAEVVHAFTANHRLELKFADKLKFAKSAGVKKAIATATQAGLLYFIAYSGNALAFWQGSRTIAEAVASGNAGSTVGTTYTVIFVLLDASIVLSQVAPFLQIFGAASAAFEKLEKDIDRETKIDGTLMEGGETLPQVAGDIELRNVSFVYQSRPDKPVLQNLSLVCPAGKHTAIVGLSGSGKSTIAGLVTRIYDPCEGEVLLDGHDIKTLNVRFLRSNISLVQQEPSLLDRSILENIAQGLVNSPAHAHLSAILLSSTLADISESLRDGQDLAQIAQANSPEVTEIIGLVTQAAFLADASGFIDRLKQGYGTSVGSSGNLISGGQKQRISVARALVRDPRILILDEATASLDSQSEKRVQAAIERVAAGRTLITIAHRLSTIRNTDNIIVMRDGRILEQGTHTDLLARDGAYADLIRLQNVNTRGSEDKVSTRSIATDDSITDKPDKSVDDVSRLGKSLDEEEAPNTEKSASAIAADADMEAKRSNLGIFKALGPIFRPYPLVLLFAFFGALICGGAYSGSAVIFGNTIGALSPCKGESSIRSGGRFWALMFFVLACIEFFANLLSWSSFGWVSENVLYKVRILSFRSLLEQNLQWHQSSGRTPSSLLLFITKDSNSLGGLTGSIVGTIVSILVNLFAAIILTHIIAWKIALVCLSVVPLMLGAGFMRLLSLSRFEERHQAAFSRSVGITVEAVNSIKTIASLSLEDEVLTTYRRSLKGPIKEVTVQSLKANLWLAISYSLSNFLYALAYWWGAKRIIAGDYTQTQFFIVLIALLVSATLWGQMFSLAPDVSRARMAIVRLLNLLEIGSTKKWSASVEPLSLTDQSNADIEAAAEIKEKALETTGGVNVSFKDVKFAYPARPDVEIIHGLNFTIRPGQFCALVGPSGAGKSTIISLLERMYIPSSGSVEIDHQDIGKREGVSFRDKIALVPQESVLFEGTIRFNVSLGARPGHEATDDEIEEACKLANIHKTIISMPEGYNTNVGPNGNQLSGGQKQRLAIARALVRKPQLLLLDESTSALDAESESLLQDGLEKAAKNITVIAIAHRLYTIRKADVIFLIEDGKCVDQGTHTELTERSESYRVNALHQAVDGQ
ncbi:Leptomycin B resistance protein pmd1-like protein 4 [Phlyctema vagabunda]|uniref:Leptomycin B resistance protein pmd1-like protein 4 n=1 Tax=Phlyctema vagabunda TaxID=108571 RepID=A0ABR4P4Z1_9HELO